MSKRVISVIYLFCFPSFLMAQNFSIVGESIIGPFPNLYAMVIIDEQSLRIKWTSEDSEQFGEVDYFNYSLEQRDGMTFLVLNSDIPEEILLSTLVNATSWDAGSEILILFGRIQEQKKYAGSYYYPTFFLGYVTDSNSKKSLIFLEDVHRYELLHRTYRDASSSLSEFGRVYDVNGLNWFYSETAWVEGVDGDGIGEGFVIEKKWDTKWKSLLIINGFISARNPKLYKENGRVKKIKVEGVESGVSKVLDVIDTPHQQTVDISFLPKPEDIRVTIADVYPGTKYRDTAIHYCITYEYEVVPLFPVLDE